MVPGTSSYRSLELAGGTPGLPTKRQLVPGTNCAFMRGRT